MHMTNRNNSITFSYCSKHLTVLFGNILSIHYWIVVNELLQSLVLWRIQLLILTHRYNVVFTKPRNFSVNYSFSKRCSYDCFWGHYAYEAHSDSISQTILSSGIPLQYNVQLFKPLCLKYVLTDIHLQRY